MERKVIGLETVKYTSKKTGNPVEGINIHCIGKAANVAGLAAERFFVSARAEGLYEDAGKLRPDQVVDFQFNRFGNIEAIYQVTEK